MRNLWLLSLCATCAFAADVPTAQYDNTRNGANNAETILTPANVKTGSFGLLGSWTLDGAMFTQPLYLSAYSGHNVLYASTMNNTVYALDADSPGSSPLWSRHLSTPSASQNSTTTPFTFGITSTPVIDRTNGWLFVVDAETISATLGYKLYKLNLSTGAVISSVTISGSVSGSGCGSSAGTLTFNPAIHTQKTPLTITGGNVYFGFASLLEPGTNWHGWMFSYDEATITRQAIFNATPNGCGGGIWDAAGGASVDGSGNIYIATGNGDCSGTSHGQSILKLNSSLSLLAHFTPANCAATSDADADVSSGRVMQADSTHITFASKDGRLNVLNDSDLSSAQVFQVTPLVATSYSGVYGGMFFQGAGYFPVVGLPYFGFSYSAGAYNTSAIGSTVPYGYAGGMAGTSNSGSNPIVWVLTFSQYANQDLPPLTRGKATLRAWNPANLAEYWNSGPIDNMATFASPVVADGSVYASGLSGTLYKFGLVAPAIPSLTQSGTKKDSGTLVMK